MREGTIWRILLLASLFIVVAPSAMEAQVQVLLGKNTHRMMSIDPAWQVIGDEVGCAKLRKNGLQEIGFFVGQYTTTCGLGHFSERRAVLARVVERTHADAIEHRACSHELIESVAGGGAANCVAGIGKQDQNLTAIRALSPGKLHAHPNEGIVKRSGAIRLEQIEFAESGTAGAVCRAKKRGLQSGKDHH